MSSSRKVAELVNSVGFDLFTVELKKLLANSSKPPSIKCDICALSETGKLRNCSTCRRIFCENCLKNTEGHCCKQAIGIPILPDADPVTLAIASQFGVDNCSVHSKSRDYYCATCDIPLCAFCLMDKQAPHAGHDMLDRAQFLSRCGDIDEVLEYAATVESHQSTSARICLDELVKLKGTTERNAVIWLDFADRVTKFLDRFIQNRVAGFARAKAQHLLAQGATAGDAAATNRRLLGYLKSVKGAEPQNIDGILAHQVHSRLKAVTDEPAVLVGYTNQDDQIPNGADSEQFDNVMAKIKDVIESLAEKLQLSEEANIPPILAAKISLQPLKTASSEDIDHNKEYTFHEQLEVPLSLEQNECEPDNVASSCPAERSHCSSVSLEELPRSRPQSMQGDQNSVGGQEEKIKDYPPSLKLTSGEHVLISSLKSPTDFHVNKLRTTNLFQRINAECMIYGRTPEKREVKFEINMPVLALYGENKRWYRARILNARLVDPDRSDSKEYHVSYVDFGNKEWIPDNSGRLHSISASLLAHAPQAIRCSLYNIVPATTDGRWSKSACEALENMFGSLSATVCVCKEPSSQGIVNAPWQIDLYRNQNSSNKAPESFRDAMIFLGHGAFPTEYSLAPLTSAAMSSNGNGSAMPAPTVASMQKARATFQPRSELALNEVYSVAVAHVNNPYDFYVHVLDEETNGLALLNNSLETFAKVQRAATNRSMPAVRLGLPVIAPYADGRYYRATVQRRVEGQGGKVCVRFVDYGNEASVEANSLLDISDDFVKLPAQAIKCRLHAIKPADGSPFWSPEASRFLQAKPREFFDALVIGKMKNGYLIELFEIDEETSTTKAIADAMVNAGVAIPDMAPIFDFGPGPETVVNRPEKKSSPLPIRTELALPTFVPPVVKIDPPPTAPVSTMAKALISSPPSRNKPADPRQPEFEKEPNGIQVIVTHVINPSDFYVRPVKLNRLVDRIEHIVKLLVDGNLTTGVAAVATDDIVFVCDDLDGRWKRGRVSSLSTVTDLNGIVDVFLVDYGYSVTSRLSKLCSITKQEVSRLAENITDLPQTVFNCALDGVKPAGMGGQVWSRKATEIFAEQMGLGENKKQVECWAVTSGVRIADGKAKGRIPVKLFVKNVIPATPFTLEGRQYVSLSGKLVDEGIALTEISLISADAISSQLLARTNDTFAFAMPIDVASVVTNPEYALNLDLLTARPEISNGTPSSADNKKGEFTAVADAGLYFPRADIFASGSELPVKIKLAILLRIDPSFAIFHFADKEAIDDLTVKCQELAENLPTPGDISELKVGAFVLGLDTNRGWWSRCVIKEVISSEEIPADDDEQKLPSAEFIVYFVDLGYIGSVSSNFIRVLRESELASELAFKPCAHFPIIFPQLTLATSLINTSTQFVEAVQDFVFTLNIFAQLREGITEMAHGGISAYLGQAVVNHRPIHAAPSTPSLNAELGSHLILQTLAYEKESDEKLCLAYRNPVFNDSSPAPILISHVQKPDIVWVQRRTEATERSILRMKEKIVEYAETTKPPQMESVRSWQPLVVCWPLDGGWYRAVCKSVLPGNIVQVYFVDYGNEDHVPLSCCRTMPLKMYSRVPPYAIKGRLSKQCLEHTKRLQFEKLVNICCFAHSIEAPADSVLPMFELLQDDPSNLGSFIPLQ